MRAFAIIALSIAASAQPLPQDKIGALCASVNSASWIAPGRVAVDCHANPSLSHYIVMDAASGRELSRTPGIRFTRSPDGVHLAHIGLLIHFAPPSSKSYTLVIDGQTVYPPGGSNQVPADPKDALLHRGIHEFLDFKWSPDSRHIAFLDRIYDWKADSPGSMTGSELNSRLSLVVVSPQRVVLHSSFREASPPPSIQWISAIRIRLSQAGEYREISVPVRNPR